MWLSTDTGNCTTLDDAKALARDALDGLDAEGHSIYVVENTVGSGTVFHAKVYASVGDYTDVPDGWTVNQSGPRNRKNVWSEIVKPGKRKRSEASEPPVPWDKSPHPGTFMGGISKEIASINDFLRRRRAAKNIT